MILVTVLFVGYYATYRLYPISLFGGLMLSPLAATIVVGQWLRQKLRLGSEPRWARACFLACVLLSMCVARDWFREPMHDIGLMFGSHGRWGCSSPDADGSAFLLRDGTMPLFLFVPIVAATAGHWLLSRSAAKGEPVP